MQKSAIPWIMAAGRAALGPVIVIGERCGWNGLTLAGIVVVALLSDIYDGVLARRWGCDTAGVRLFDSMADTVFYLGVAVALWIGVPQVWREFGWLLGALLGLEACRFALDFLKFGKPASYHSYLAKSWGLVMACAVVGVFALGRPNVFVAVALVLGILCDLEGLVMSLIMPQWTRDVKTIAAALRLRGDMRAATPRVRAVVAGVALLMVPCALAAAQGTAASYLDGTTTIPRGTSGRLDFTVPEKLVFQADKGSAMVAIRYESIKDFEYHTGVRHQLGFLPMIAAGLLVKREKRHFFTVTYTDPADAVQVTRFEVNGEDYPGFCAVLRARAPAQSRGTCLAESK